jgi:thioredoxin 1
MHPILEQLSKQLGDQVRIVKIDVDKNQQLASQLQVCSVPTLAIFKNGEIVWRQPGVLPANVLSDKLKSFM